MVGRNCVSALFGSIALSAFAASPPEAQLVTLNFPNNDIREVLPLYESLTHFKIIRDNFVQGKISISVAEPVTTEKAIEIIERTFFADGYAIIQIASDTVEIIGSGASAKTRGIPTVGQPNQLPVHERLVSYFIKFEHIDACEAQSLFTQYLSPLRAYTSFTQVKGANALWVTERTSVIRQLIEAAKKIDVDAYKNPSS